jgi:hypothetical protein
MTNPSSSESRHPKSKTAATWIAILVGPIGLHRFYLHGLRDLGGWLYPLPTLLGAYGVQRMRDFGQDDQLAWVLIPWLGGAIAAAMLSAIVYGLTSDEKWNARFNSSGEGRLSGWGAVLGVVLALLLGAGVLMATIAFSAQRYFEYQTMVNASSSAPSTCGDDRVYFASDTATFREFPVPPARPDQQRSAATT